MWVKNPPPKRDMNEDAWMDVVIKTLPLQHISSIYIREIGEGQNSLRGRSPPQKEEEGDEVVPSPKNSVPTSEKCSDVEADPQPLYDVPPL